MKSEKSTTQKLILSRKTIARLNDNQFRTGNDGKLFNIMSYDVNDGCTSLRPITQNEEPTQLQGAECLFV